MICTTTGCTPDIVYTPFPTTSLCPDTFIHVSKAELSSNIDERGNPIDPGTVFAPVTPAIICTFWMTDDLCCKTVTISWFYGDTVISKSEKTGIDVKVPDHMVLSTPKGGLAQGDYHVVIYIDLFEMFDLPFQIK